MLDVQVDVPPLRPVYRNEREVITMMTGRLLSRIRERTASGRAVDGALPRGKGDNPPLRRTGTFLASIGQVVRERGGRVTGVVRPLGARPASEAASVRQKRAAARARTDALRASAVLGAFLRTSTEPSASVGRRKRGGGLALSRIRVRTATDNAALAAILSVPPRDKRGINGARGVYRVFEASNTEQAEMGEIARAHLIVELAE